MDNALAVQSSRCKKMRIGIVDLVSSKPTRLFEARVLNSNYATIMPQAVAVWAEQKGHQVQYMCFTTTCPVISWAI